MYDKKNLENIELIIDNHNEVNEDALNLVSSYYLDITDVRGSKIMDISDKEISMMIQVSGKKIYRIIKFPNTFQSSDEVVTFFYFCLAEARKKAPEDYPKTRIEIQIEKTLDLNTYITKVKNKREISSNIIEITFHEGLESLPDLKNDAFMYFIVHEDINHKYPKNFVMQNFRELNAKKDNPYSAAYYTIRSFRKNEIDVWFVIHDNPGPLANWAVKVNEDSEVAIWGPRTTFTPPEGTDNFLFIADETAQAAVLASIENLDNKSNYKCLFETQNKSSQFEFLDPNNCIEWIYRNNEPAGKGSKLSKKIEELEIKTDNLYVFGAGEAKQISLIRKILKQKFDLETNQMSFTGYWRRTS
jgi:NADPH-dependent ferric siderophore reductase|tara:strand:+ start:42 stop:1115 length:1074 start_codon:yes stop_codon:yes gene_type:complete